MSLWIRLCNHTYIHTYCIGPSQSQQRRARHPGLSPKKSRTGLAMECMRSACPPVLTIHALMLGVSETFWSHSRASMTPVQGFASNTRATCLLARSRAPLAPLTHRPRPVPTATHRVNGVPHSTQRSRRAAAA